MRKKDTVAQKGVFTKPLTTHYGWTPERACVRGRTRHASVGRRSSIRAHNFKFCKDCRFDDLSDLGQQVIVV